MTATIDVRKLHLPSGPSEWEPVDAETLASLQAPTGILTPAQWATLRRIWGRRWFLIRADTGLCSRCTRCGQMHTYVTLGCVPIPYNGITEVFGALRKHYGADTITDIIAFGDVVPITRSDARKLYEQIRAKGFDL
jgi:hypothetical protein